MTNDVNELQESEDYFTEQSHTSEESWSAAVVAALEGVASYDPRGPQDVLLPEKKYLYCQKTNAWRDVSEYREPLPPEPPDELSAFTALKREPGQDGVDLRPHIFDNTLKKWLLCDSGSMITAFPPERGDVEDKNIHLKAVNGSKIKCFGYKDIVVQIHRKPYKFRAIKADVDTPVLGWDFFRYHRLNFIWNDWGDITINDPKSNITAILKYKSLPFEKSSRMKRLSVASSTPNLRPRGVVGQAAVNLAFEVASIQELGVVEKEDVSEML